MKNIPSVLLIDDEIEFHEAFVESLKSEIQKNIFQLELASSGKQGLEIIQNNNKQGKQTFAFIDIILPDILGDELVNEIDQDNNQIKGILISAHKGIHELEEIKNKYAWLVDSISKPLNKNQLKNAIKLFIGNSILSEFDYASLEPSTADFVIQEAKKIKSLIKQTVTGIIETGERLYRVKQKLKHGEFMNWIEKEIKCHYSTALHFIRVWETFGEQKEQIANMGINVSVLYLLAAPSTPQELRTEIVEMAKAGNLISFAEAKRLKKEYTEIKDNNRPSKKSAAITTIDIIAESPPTPVATSKPKPTGKSEILAVINRTQTTNKFWNLGKHVLYHGSTQHLAFRQQLTANIALNIGFPNSQYWTQEALFPVQAKSTLVFHSVFQDLDLVTLRNIIHKSIEICTESDEDIVFSFLPDPEILLIADNLNCRCFIAEPDLKLCRNIVSVWQKVHGQS